MRQTTDCDNEDVFVGIDVHLKQWSVSIYCDGHRVKSFVQAPNPIALVNYLHRHFPGASHQCVYEAGFCGFWICRALRQLGVDCIVVSPADVPSTQKEQFHKRDRVDASKLARELMKGELTPIFIPDLEAEGDRMLLRTRFSLVSKQTRAKNQIKALLRVQGVALPQQYAGRSWSQSMLRWLDQVAAEHGQTEAHRSMSRSARKVLRLRLDELRDLQQRLADAHRAIGELAQHPRYCRRVELLTSIPGIGQLTAMVVLLELIQIDRFASFDRLKSFAGLVPSCHRSGNRGSDGPLTHRRNSQLRNVLIESAWQAVRRDQEMKEAYAKLKRRMRSQEAIVRIATKQLARVRYVLLQQRPFKLEASASLPTAA